MFYRDCYVSSYIAFVIFVYVLITDNHTIYMLIIEK